MNTLDRALYRGKCIDGGEWVEGVPVHQDGECWMVLMHGVCCVSGAATENILVDIKTVGQFTGLTDKNGVKVFEGDIYFNRGVSSNYGKNVPYCNWALVGFYNYGFSNNCHEFGVRAKVHCGTSMIPTNCVIEGNIHDNPELIEVSK